MAAQLYSAALKGILTACPSVLTERERKRRDGENARSKRGGCANPISSDGAFRITVSLKEHIICQS